MPSPAIVGEGLALREVLLRRADVVFVKGILEASEGLAVLFAEERVPKPARRAGAPAQGAAEHPTTRVTLATPCSRARELDALLCDLEAELREGIDVRGGMLAAAGHREPR